MPIKKVELITHIPPLFFIGGELGDLYDHAVRCCSPRTNIYALDQELRWAKLYNRALRLLFRKHWASRLPTEITDKILQYAREGCKFVLDPDGFQYPVVIDFSIFIFISPSDYHSLQWAYYFGNYDWETKLSVDRKYNYTQNFNLLCELSESQKQTYEAPRIYYTTDIRTRTHYRKFERVEMKASMARGTQK